MSIKQIEIENEGAAIKVTVINPDKPNAPEYYSVNAIKSIVPVYNENIGIVSPNLVGKTPYAHKDMFIVAVTFHNEQSNPSIRFDLATVENQPGWTLDFSGLEQAVTDMNGWLAAGSSIAPVSELLSLASASYIDSTARQTTSGKNTVMFTCVTGVEEINGIVRPAGVYTYQPTLNNVVNIINYNANDGQIILDEL